MLWNFSLFKVMSLILFLLMGCSFSTFLWMSLLKTMLIIDWEMCQFLGVSFSYSILLDWMSLLFMSVVFIISGSVMYYSDAYMNHELNKNSFCFIVFLFVMSMLFLIISPSLLSLILGWDGLGLVSYLLVIFYQNYKSYAAGMLTCLTNRLGDSALLVVLGVSLGLGSFDFIHFLLENIYECMMMSVFVVLAAMTKSAQIPFSSWLPAAMAAPTPVSALVHSSTLVTAGVYLLIRFFPLFNQTFMETILFILGMLTMLMSSFGAMFEMDLKKIIALSTLSQLGLMMMTLGSGLYILSFFHLLIHALFKAALFLCAGSMIHSFKGSQDLRFLNSVSSIMPLTSACFLVSSFSLTGFPFLAAFYSKDKILEEIMSSGMNLFIILWMVSSILLTSVYTFRLISYISAKNFLLIDLFPFDSSVMTKSMMILTMGGIMGGSMFNWLIFDSAYDNLFLFLKTMILLMIIFGVGAGFILNFSKISFLSFYFSSMWFMVSMSVKLLVISFLKFSQLSFKLWDTGWNESFGPQGIGKEVSFVSANLVFSNSNSIKFVMMTSVFLGFIMLFLI